MALSDQIKVPGNVKGSSSGSTSASDLATGTLALARGGTGVDLSATGAATHVLAQAANHTVSARALVAADIPSTLGATTFSGGSGVTIQTGGQLKFGDSSYEVSRSDTNSSFINYAGGMDSTPATGAVLGLSGKTRSGEWAGGAYLQLSTAAASSKFSIFDKNSAEQFRVDDNGTTLPVTKTPASASATGVTGNIAWDASYIYVCTATDTWKRVAIATW